MKATSINIQPVTGGSEEHNLRTKELKYVRKDLSEKNESYTADTVSNRLATIKRTYRENVGQRLQKSATPIREGVVVIDKNTTMQQLKDFGDKCEKRFGIKPFQIHIHRDEGHKNSEEWKPNLHAHIVYDWTDNKGKSIKLNRYDMMEMQSILAESLQMKRGVSSDKKHLNAVQFKAQAEESRLEKITEESKRIFQANIKFTDDNKTLRATHSELKNINSHLIDSNKNLSADNEKLKEFNSRGSKSNYDLVVEVARAEQRNRELEKEVIKVEESKKRAIVATTNDVLKKIGADYKLTDDFKIVQRSGGGIKQGK